MSVFLSPSLSLYSVTLTNSHYLCLPLLFHCLYGQDTLVCLWRFLMRGDHFKCAVKFWRNRLMSALLNHIMYLAASDSLQKQRVWNLNTDEVWRLSPTDVHCSWFNLVLNLIHLAMWYIIPGLLSRRVIAICTSLQCRKTFYFFFSDQWTTQQL